METMSSVTTGSVTYRNSIVAVASSLAIGGAVLISLWYAHLTLQDRTCLTSSQTKDGNGHDHGDDVGPSSSTHIDPHVDLLPSHLKREIHKERRRKESIRFLSMKTPMYDNIEMYGPDGTTMLCTIGKKKAHWYVNKKLAVWRSADVMTNSQKDGQEPSSSSSSTKTMSIRLLFTPRQSHRTVQTVMYDTSFKKNVCVACGTSDGLMRHYVVPYSYRKRLPTRYKSHLPHDVVLLCLDCHICAEQAGREQQDDVYERTIRTDPNTRFAVLPNRTLKRVRSCAQALLRHAGKLPIDRIRQYQKIVYEHLQNASLLSPPALPSAREEGDDDEAGRLSGHININTTNIPVSALQELARMETDLPNPRYVPIADLVVETLQSDDDVANFVRGWRRLFLETLRPRFLPMGWSIDSPVQSNDNGKDCFDNNNNDNDDNVEWKEDAGHGWDPLDGSEDGRDNAEDEYEDKDDDDDEINSSRCCEVAEDDNSHSTLESEGNIDSQEGSNVDVTTGYGNMIVDSVERSTDIPLFWTAVVESPSLLQTTITFCETERKRNCKHREGETPSAAAAMVEAVDLRRRFTDQVVMTKGGGTKEVVMWQNLSDDDRDEFLSRLFLPRGLGGFL